METEIERLKAEVARLQQELRVERGATLLGLRLRERCALFVSQAIEALGDPGDDWTLIAAVEDEAMRRLDLAALSRLGPAGIAALQESVST